MGWTEVVVSFGELLSLIRQSRDKISTSSVRWRRARSGTKPRYLARVQIAKNVMAVARSESFFQTLAVVH